MKRSLLALAVALIPVASFAQKPVRVFISVDMEGIGGIVHEEMTSSSGGNEYERGRKLMVGEVNAAIEGAREGGATDFLVNDSHGSMRNIKIEDLASPARLISNNSKPLGMMEGIGSEFAAVFFIGFHSMAGAPGVMAHTGTGTIASIQVDGRAMSEGGLNARVAGAFGVPVALATGDDDFVREIRTLVEGDFETVAVKRTIRLQTAELLHPEESRRLIGEAARRAIGKLSSLRPTQAKRPTTVEITYKSPDLADIAAVIPTVERTGRFSVRFQSDDYLKAYQFIRVLYRNLSE